MCDTVDVEKCSTVKEKECAPVKREECKNILAEVCNQVAIISFGGAGGSCKNKIHGGVD